MDEQKDFGFCPRCGAFMEDGICRSCGYNGWSEEVHEPEEKKGRRMSTGKKALIGAGIIFGAVGGMVMLVCMVFYVGLGIMKAGNKGSERASEGFDRYYDYYRGPDEQPSDEDSSSGKYVPNEDDAFYKEITDATSQDCSYSVIWKSEAMYGDGSDGKPTYDCVYPILTKEGKAADEFSSINTQIEKLAMVYETSYQDYAGGTISTGYVTYMDEEKFSVVMRHTLYTKTGTVPRISAISFDMESGKAISHSEMTDIDMELVKQFRSRNDVQNGEVEFVEKATDEELLSLLKNEKNSIMFYTPVGLEIGFNYEGEESGWVTVTLKKTVL